MADRVAHAGIVSVAFVGGLGMVNAIAAPEPEKAQQPQPQMATVCDRLRIGLMTRNTKYSHFARRNRRSWRLSSTPL